MTVLRKTIALIFAAALFAPLCVFAPFENARAQNCDVRSRVSRNIFPYAHTSKAALASRIAFARYSFVKRLERRRHIPFGTFNGLEFDDLFPKGKSDVAYAIATGSDEHPNRLYCFQMKNGRDALLYRVNLVIKNTPPRSAERIGSLLDYIRSIRFEGAAFGGKTVCESYCIEGRNARLARKDLAAKRDYALYRERTFTNVLEVYLLSGLSGDVYANSASYDLPVKPAGKGITEAAYDLFYDQYGFPVARNEL